jgi:hypothetical protein
MRCIAERLLPEGHERTYLQREITNEQLVWPPATKSYHIFCSKKNPGALKLLQEFADKQGLTLKHTPSRCARSGRRSSAQNTRQTRA